MSNRLARRAAFLATGRFPALRFFAVRDAFRGRAATRGSSGIAVGGIISGGIGAGISMSTSTGSTGWIAAGHTVHTGVPRAQAETASYALPPRARAASAASARFDHTATIERARIARVDAREIFTGPRAARTLG